MTQINWLHLTDLHIGGREKHLLPAIKNAFREDLKKLHQKSGPWDLVIFTGDLTQRASAEEFALFDTFLGELWQWLADLGSNPKLVTVPGNHDLVRPDADDPVVMLLGQWQAQGKVRDQFWANENSAYRKIVEAAFANYQKWWASTPYKLEGQRGLLPGDFSSIFEKEGASIGFEGWSVYVRLDEETLKAIADTTRGEYFHAGTATDLKKVYQSLNARLVMERKETEVTFLFEAIAAGLLLAASVFSLLWFNRTA